jgi:hypothetical protein
MPQVSTNFVRHRYSRLDPERKDQEGLLTSESTPTTEPSSLLSTCRRMRTILQPPGRAQEPFDPPSSLYHVLSPSRTIRLLPEHSRLLPHLASYVRTSVPDTEFTIKTRSVNSTNHPISPHTAPSPFASLKSPLTPLSNSRNAKEKGT